MKKMLAIILIVALALPLTMFNFVNANDELPAYAGYVFFNGERATFDSVPLSIKGNVYVPLMETAKLKGVTVKESDFKAVEKFNDVAYVTAKEFANVSGLYFYENKLSDMAYIIDNKVASIDGEYTVWSAADSKGDAAKIILTIKDGKVVDVKFDEQRLSGEWKFADGKYTARWGSSKGVDPDALLAKMLEELVAKQSPSKVDVATGATSTHEKLTDLAATAIAKAKMGNLQPLAPKVYKDGKYEIVGLPNGDYTPVVKMVVKNGKITSVKYDEINANGVGKRGSDYVTRWANARGVDPEAIIAGAEAQLIKNQDANLVDTLTGATSWGKNFTKMAAGALDHAARTKMEVEPSYKDGLYWVRGVEAGGYIPILKLVVKNGDIANVEFHDINAETMLSKRYNDAYLTNWGTKREVNPMAILKEMEAKIVETQDFASVDSISGATSWAKNIKSLGTAALVDASKENIYMFVGTKTAASAHVVQLLAIAREGSLLGLDYKEYQNSNYLPKQDNVNYVGADSAWVTRRSEEFPGLVPLERLEKMIGIFMETKSVEKLDTVTGASNWKKGVVELAPKALNWVK